MSGLFATFAPEKKAQMDTNKIKIQPTRETIEIIGSKKEKRKKQEDSKTRKFKNIPMTN